jgi:hypothetical protein
VFLTPACSLAISGPAADRRPGEAPRCDTGKAPIVLDAIGATAFGLVGLAALGQEGGELLTVVGIGLSTALLLSVSHGTTKTNACTEALAQFESERRSADPGVATRASITGRGSASTSRPSSIGAPTRPVAKVPAPDPGANPPAPRVPAPTAQAAPAPPDRAPAAPAAPAPASPAVTPPVPAPPAVRSEPEPPASADDTWSEFWREIR